MADKKLIVVSTAWMNGGVVAIAVGFLLSKDAGDVGAVAITAGAMMLTLGICGFISCIKGAPGSAAREAMAAGVAAIVAGMFILHETGIGATIGGAVFLACGMCGLISGIKRTLLEIRK